MRYAPWVVDFRRHERWHDLWSQSRFATANEAYAFAESHARAYELRLWLERPGDLCPVPLYRVDDYDLVTVDDDEDEQPPADLELRELEFPDPTARAECYADLRHTGVHCIGGGASPLVRITLTSPRVAS